MQLFTAFLGIMGKRKPGLALGHAAQLMTEIDKRPRVAEEVRVRQLASLWSGLGAVYVVDDEVIVKEIRFPDGRSHSERRDIESYKVEAAFYARHAPRLLAPPVSLDIPKPLLVKSDDAGVTLCISRLEGKPVGGNGDLNREQAHAALDALASLHAAYWGVEPPDLDGLQPLGSFWHLDTRALELSAMPRTGWLGRLFLAARALDVRLKADGMQTCIHGDPKDANLLFVRTPRGPRGSSRVRCQLFDFQYVGRGPPTKDLAYLFTCCEGTASERVEDELLAHYHQALSARLEQRGLQPPTLEAIKVSLQIAYADLARWMSGWEGGWWAKDLLLRRTRALLDKLDGGVPLESEQAYTEALFKLCPPGRSDVGAGGSPPKEPAAPAGGAESAPA
jgi:hypothetical protein